MRPGVGRFSKLDNQSDYNADEVYNFCGDTGELVERYKEPIVLLLGWTGSQDNELVDYSKIYDQYGLDDYKLS